MRMVDESKGNSKTPELCRSDINPANGEGGAVAAGGCQEIDKTLCAGLPSSSASRKADLLITPPNIHRVIRECDEGPVGS